MTGTHHLMCINLLCTGNCQQAVDRNRSDEIGIIIADAKPKNKINLKKVLITNIQVVDCIIILKQLKRIIHEQQN